jgi:O-antigen/teichoic acid export membrane protein
MRKAIFSLPTRLRSGVALILAGSIAGQGIIVLSSPLLTRLYDAADFGSLAVITSLSAIGGAVVTLNWERAVVVPRSPGIARSLVWLALASAVVLSSVLALVAWLSRDWLATTFSAPFLTRDWWLIPVTVMAIALFKIYSSTLTRRQAYGRLGIRNAMQGWAQVAFNILMGLASVGGSLGLTLGTAVGRIFAVSGAGRLPKAGTEFVERTRYIPPRRMFAVASARFRRLPLVSTWSSLLNVVGLQAPILVLTASYGVYEIGFVALTMRVLAAPVGIIADATAQYVEGSLGVLIRARGRIGPLLNRTEFFLALIVVLPLIAIITGGPSVFSAVFGEEWRTAGQYARIFALTYALQLIVVPVSRVLLLIDRTKVQLVWDLSRSVIVIGAVAMVSSLGGSLTTAIVVLASVQSIMYVTLLVLIRITVANHDGKRGIDVSSAP